MHMVQKKEKVNQWIEESKRIVRANQSHDTSTLLHDIQLFQSKLEHSLAGMEIEGDYFGFYLLSDIVLAYQSQDVNHFWMEIEKLLRYTSNDTTIYLKHLNLLLRQFIHHF